MSHAQLAALCLLSLSMTLVACDTEAPEPRSPDAGQPVDMSPLDMRQAGDLDAGVSLQDMSDAPADLDAMSDVGMPEDDGAVVDMGPMLQPLPDLATYEACAPFVRTGPYTTGVTTLMIDGSPVEVFYPSSASPGVGAERARYDLRTWLPEDARQKIPADEPTTFEMMAYRDVALATTGQPHPVVLFSHGFAGYRLQSSFLLSHLASWGMVVASAEHPGRGLAAVLTESLSGGKDVEVISGVLDELERLNDEDDTSMFYQSLDLDRVAMTGHSAGGAAAIELGQAFPDRFATVLAYTPAVKPLGSNEFAPPLAGRKYFISGSKDGLTSASDTSTYARMQDPVWRHLVINGAGHLAFTDICVIGREKGGILKIAENSGVEVPLFVSILATDGCRRNDLRAEIAWPMIAHFSVAELSDALGMEQAVAAEAYLDAEATACFGDLTRSFEGEVRF